MTKEENRWVAKAEFEPGTVSYKFDVDGRWITAPVNPKTITANGRTISVLVVN